MSQVSAIVLLCLCGTACAATIRPRLPSLHHGSLATIPMRRYADDCGTKDIKRKVFGGLQTENPGAGMNPEEYTFATVYKDGFFAIDCVKDMLFHQGDKFGDGKFSYNSNLPNVSIVHYTSLIAKEDQEEMTHEVCFSFCRTIPEMQFFGLVNGRDCYCAPYFKPMAGDSSECDAVCPGKPTNMCGGKFKSSIFEMHACQDTLENLAGAVPKLTEATDDLEEAADEISKLGVMMQATGVFWQDVAGALGQPAPSDLMQVAKVFAGELEHAGEAATKLKAKMDTVSGAGQGLVTANAQPKTLEDTNKFESLTKQAEQLTAAADDMTENLQDLAQSASPKFSSTVNASLEYYPLTYFIDKKIESLYSVCGGTNVKKPIVNATRDQCALACDADVHDCVGFSYFAVKGTAPMCFLFSKFKKLTYIINCAGAFLQTKTEKKGDGSEIGCFGKLSEFPSSIAPQASGKCDGCLREASKFCSK